MDVDCCGDLESDVKRNRSGGGDRMVIEVEGGECNSSGSGCGCGSASRGMVVEMDSSYSSVGG